MSTSRQSTSKQTAFLLAALAAAALAQAEPAAAAEPGTARTVSVSATGHVSVEPDLAQISTAVVTEADTARQALSQNNAAMAKVIDGLKGAGIQAADIHTTSVNVEPRYRQEKDRAPVITGYRVTNQVRITARDLKRLGDVLDQAVTLGANQIGGIAFEVSKAEQRKDEARKAAMENALRRAKLYAAAAGAEVGPVLTISEDVRMPQPRPVAMARAGFAANAVPIEAGTQQLEVELYVTWSLKRPAR